MINNNVYPNNGNYTIIYHDTNLFKVIQIAITIPIASATREQFFSAKESEKLALNIVSEIFLQYVLIDNILPIKLIGTENILNKLT